MPAVGLELANLKRAFDLGAAWVAHSGLVFWPASTALFGVGFPYNCRTLLPDNGRGA
jgi:hypothetical protein